MALQKCCTQANARVHFSAVTECSFQCLIKNHFKDKRYANYVCYYTLNNWFRCAGHWKTEDRTSEGEQTHVCSLCKGDT